MRASALLGTQDAVFGTDDFDRSAEVGVMMSESTGPPPSPQFNQSFQIAPLGHLTTRTCSDFEPVYQPLVRLQLLSGPPTQGHSDALNYNPGARSFRDCSSDR